MDEFEHRQDEHELSLASLARLEAVLSSLRVAANQSVEALPKVEWRHRRRFGWYWRDHIYSDPMVILPEHEGAARELIGAIEETVQKIAGRLDSEWRRGPAGAYEGADRHGDSVRAIGAVTFCVEQIPILRGEIELRKTEPIAAGIPDVVVEFLVTVPGAHSIDGGQ